MFIAYQLQRVSSLVCEALKHAPAVTMRLVVVLTIAATLPCIISCVQRSCEGAKGKCVERDAVPYCKKLLKHRCPNSAHVCCKPVLKARRTKVLKCHQTSKCSSKGGTCYAESKKCPALTSMRKKLCSGYECVCCIKMLKARRRKVEKCGPTSKCRSKGGTCYAASDLSQCPSSTHKRKKLCSGYQCVCCIKKQTKCMPSKKCDAKHGFCFNKKLRAAACASGRVRKSGCRGKTCACCLPEQTQCHPSQRCAAKHGFCFNKNLHDACTSGRVRKTGCRGRNCACCLPGPAVCRPAEDCTKWKGFCFAKTNPQVCANGDVFKDGCSGEECVCCIPRDPQTPTTTTPTTTTTTTTTTPVCRCGIINGRRVVGGQQVDPPNKYPWIVGLDVINNSTYDCVGNLINDRYVLTAAHCLFNPQTLLQIPTSDIMIGIADHDQSSTADDVQGVTRRVGVQEVIIFSNFSVVNVDFDIALLKLQEPLDFTARELGPICLPANDDQTYGGVQSTVVGWGTTGENEGQPDILREVSLPILEAARCEMLMVNFFTITETMICAGLDEGGKDACLGDSGGPLSVVEDERHVIVGVSAFGEGCARPALPGVYSRVSKFLTWIMENTQDAVYCP